MSLIAVSAWSMLSIALVQQVTSSSESVAKNSNEFANDLYKELAKKPGNVLVCPLSLDVALALVNEGAGGQTRTQLTKVLRLDQDKSIDKNSFKAFLDSIKDRSLKVITQLVYTATHPYNRGFVDLAVKYYYANVHRIDKGSQQNYEHAEEVINKNVEQQTNGKIRNLIQPGTLSGAIQTMIFNAVHFQAAWRKPFQPAKIGHFKVSDRNKVETGLMTQTSYFDYKEDPELQAKVLLMDYKDSKYSMLFILPNREDGLPEVEARLAHTSLDDILKGLKTKSVLVTIPRFTVETTLMLKDVLSKMGATDMFSNKADLTGISAEGPTSVSDVIQKTFISVNENGTEAASATIVMITGRSMGEKAQIFAADRPFHFILTDKRAIVFNGRFVQPSAN